MLSNAAENRAIVYLGTRLSRDEFLDDVKRRECLDAGTRMLSNLPGLELVRVLPGACAIIVRGSERVLCRLERLLANERVGDLAIEDPEKPLFRAAR